MEEEPLTMMDCGLVECHYREFVSEESALLGVVGSLVRNGTL
jgi:hypothetical protein